ncbi:MAG: hypothetical protein C0621_10815 [Desulfuromonas sp.]|nr:MAG: hypothetical protein C0621_10815 [Desulfuromonas sp.]
MNADRRYRMNGREPQPRSIAMTLAEFSLLVVEDDELTRTMLDLFFRKKGMKVTLVSGGLEAVRLLQSQSFDLVLTDLFMPGINGNLLLQFIRSLAPQTPVIAMSSMIEEADAGFDLRVSKPLEFDRLLPAMAELAENGRMVEPPLRVAGGGA